MAPVLNTQTVTGLPICLSGFTHPVALSKEMADHDRRRKGFKKLRFGASKDLHAIADQERVRRLLSQRNHEEEEERVSQEIRSGEEVAGDLAAADVVLVLHDLSCISLSSCTAKAA
ncbi:uncharacterized protein LOC113781927 [Coffea eugenioides]|uniref:uncharacterized protein LOC113781927 n=1 Tax=Coffea eugenioides TaxID=49369 RepID=UPI000F60EDE9|nr:uncharacterized protein LOC113781927 [Coffea eugenioides]